MKVNAWFAGQLRLDLRVAVAGVVVDDHMEVQMIGDTFVNVAQEGEELLVTVSPFALGNHLTAGHIKGGEKC